MPFIETYLVGADPEELQHINGIRFRVTGHGLLRPSIYSLDKVISKTLMPLTMNEIDRIEPTRLTNFKSQRALLRVETNFINDFFKIDKIIFFAKPIYKSYPGTK